MLFLKILFLSIASLFVTYTTLLFAIVIPCNDSTMHLPKCGYIEAGKPLPFYELNNNLFTSEIVADANGKIGLAQVAQGFGNTLATGKIYSNLNNFNFINFAINVAFWGLILFGVSFLASKALKLINKPTSV